MPQQMCDFLQVCQTTTAVYQYVCQHMGADERSVFVIHAIFTHFVCIDF
jgi:hypothetical protein